MVHINQIRDLINFIHNTPGIRVEKGGKAPIDGMNRQKIYRRNRISDTGSLAVQGISNTERNFSLLRNVSLLLSVGLAASVQSTARCVVWYRKNERK